MDIVLTTAGIQAVINAKETGTNAVTISELGVGTGKYTTGRARTRCASSAFSFLTGRFSRSTRRALRSLQSRSQAICSLLST